VPLNNNFNTTFEISYKTDGVKNDAAPIFAELETHLDSIDCKHGAGCGGLSKEILIAIVASAALLCFLIVGCIIKRRLAK